jgi:pimeloyl-ACP methyl ester carboxylesterase
MDAVGVDPAAVVGHSMGGAVAQQLALGRVGRVSSLVLVGTGARLRVAPAILNGIREDFDGAVDLITRYAWSSSADAALIELGRRDLRDTGPDVLLDDFRACDRFDVMERLGEIDCPTLVIGGSADRLTPLKYSRYLSERIAGARLVTVPGAGHMVMLERSDEVVAAISDFLDSSR